MDGCMKRRKNKVDDTLWWNGALAELNNTVINIVCLGLFLVQNEFVKTTFDSSGFKGGWLCLVDCAYYLISFLEWL